MLDFDRLQICPISAVWTETQTAVSEVLIRQLLRRPKSLFISRLSYTMGHRSIANTIGAFVMITPSLTPSFLYSCRHPFFKSDVSSQDFYPTPSRDQGSYIIALSARMYIVLLLHTRRSDAYTVCAFGGRMTTLKHF